MLAAIRRSISLKFMTAVMATTFIAVLLSGLANLAYNIHDFRTAAVKDVTSQADILADLNIAALEFDDRQSAEHALNQLGMRPGILSAGIYRADGTVFAAYTAPGPQSLSAPARPSADGHIIDGNDLHVFKGIVRGTEKLGTIYVRASYPLDARLERDAKMIGALVAGSLLIAALVSLWLQSAVTRPIRAVTDAVRKLVAQRDFSQRVPRTTDDETGALVDAFNSMFSEIGEHAAKLELSNNSLKHEVGERTRAELALHELNASLEERIAARSLELQRANEQLHHSQKMEAIGQLTGGVAHDFNNVLQVIAGNLQLLAMTLPQDAVASRRIETAKFATDRGAKLASQLLAFARRQPLQPSPTNLGRVLRDMDDMLRRALGESVEMETVITGGLWNTMVDPNQLENVILNLAINARDAMKGDGKLTLELGNAMLDDHYVAQEVEVAAGQYIMLAISDTGCGMPPGVLERAFEPFFTTKREGEGTGLGLSMAFGFVKQSSGHIKIYSEVGSGTTIKIYLPRSHHAEQEAFNMMVGEVVGGSETILVVEDDLAVQATAVDMLTQLGYRVLRANNGDAAMHVLQCGERIDMLFTDVVMPGVVRSPDLARLALNLFPEIAVLYTSGYTRNAIVHGGRLDPGVELISKPYRGDDLARKIRHVFANRKQVNRLRLEKEQALLQLPAQQQGLKIMVVEDDPDNRNLLDELLTLLGHQVTAAADGEEGLRLFKTGQVDVLITDLNLPGMSGIELAALLREASPSLRVIVASGAGMAQGAPGTAQYASLLKPYRVDQLQDILVGAETQAS
ncbi:MAG TPA: response regulator [Telluria sp.]